MEGIIVAIVTALGFLGIAGFVIYKILKGPDLPKGHRYELARDGIKVIVVIDKSLEVSEKDSSGKPVSWLVEKDVCSSTDLLESSLHSVKFGQQAFQEKGYSNAVEKSMVFYYCTNDVFDNLRGPGNIAWSKNVSAWSAVVSGMFKTNKMPLLNIRSRYINDAIKRAQPAMHELIHVLYMASAGNYDRLHTDTKLWQNKDSKGTVEDRAIELYLSYKK